MNHSAGMDEPIRSAEANNKMWAMLTDISLQKKWPVDGVMQTLRPWEFKVIFTAGLKKHQRIAAGIDGGFVMLGTPTSKMKKSEMNDLIEIMFAWGAEQTPPIEWSDPTKPPLESYDR